MIIEYATKEIRDRVMRDLKNEMVAGIFTEKIERSESSDVELCLFFPFDSRLHIRKSESTPEINLVYHQELDAANLKRFFTICDIINFLKAGAKK